MDKFNTDSITTLRQGLEVVESNYISKVQSYLTSGELGYNNKNFTVSYK